MDRSGLLDIFLVETDELVEDLETALVQLEERPDDPELLHRIFRAAHTLKGNAGLVGLAAAEHFTHVFENVLDRLRSHGLAVDGRVISTLLGTVDTLRELLRRIRAGEPLDDAGFLPAATVRLEELLDRDRSPAAAAAAPAIHGSAAAYRIELGLPEGFLAEGQDPGLLLRDLAELGALTGVEASLAALPDLGALDPHRLYLRWQADLATDRPVSEVEGVFVFVSDRSGISIRPLAGAGPATAAPDAPDATPAAPRPDAAARGPGRPGAAAALRVDVEKLDRLVNLVGELVIAISQVQNAAQDEHAGRAARLAAAEGLQRIGRELQEQVLAVRMVPVEETFTRFKRAVRDLGVELGKQVVLETLGTETELDKNVIEGLVDPLKHMVRNCIAHGLERPDERRRAGKPETGTIVLAAEQREGAIVIEVRDDGRGIDVDRVVARARERGLVADGATPTEAEAIELLFHPGFSTAEEVSELCGRGVGLDVVRKNVEGLRGTVEVETVRGRGTTFRLRLPLTLAILEAMNVRAGDGTVTLPLASVLELVSPGRDSLRTVQGRGELLEVRGEPIPVVRIHDVLGLARAPFSADTAVVVIGSAARKYGLLVDRVLGIEQAVIKPLARSFEALETMEKGFRRPEILAGATILGNGLVAPILDLRGIEASVFGSAA